MDMMNVIHLSSLCHALSSRASDHFLTTNGTFIKSVTTHLNTSCNNVAKANQEVFEAAFDDTAKLISTACNEQPRQLVDGITEGISQAATKLPTADDIGIRAIVGVETSDTYSKWRQSRSAIVNLLKGSLKTVIDGTWVFDNDKSAARILPLQANEADTAPVTAMKDRPHHPFG